MSKEKVIIYTDGAARGNPGPAGWGTAIMMGDKVVELGGRSDHATNNQMELMAAIEGLKYLPKFCKKVGVKLNEIQVEIFADSKYVIHGATVWIHGWLKSNWINSAKKPVMNRELWEQLHELTQEFKPTWQYVKGHSGDTWNDRVDEIATTFADNTPVELRK